MRSSARARAQVEAANPQNMNKFLATTALVGAIATGQAKGVEIVSGDYYIYGLT
jgi:hypothetical protein